MDRWRRVDQEEGTLGIAECGCRTEDGVGVDGCIERKRIAWVRTCSIRDAKQVEEVYLQKRIDAGKASLVADEIAGAWESRAVTTGRRAGLTATPAVRLGP